MSKSDRLRDNRHCPACGIRYNKECRKRQHHVLPIRFFSETGLIQWLCEKCHDEIELQIPVKRMNPILWYFQLVIRFVYEKQKEREVNLEE